MQTSAGFRTIGEIVHWYVSSESGRICRSSYVAANSARVATLLVRCGDPFMGITVGGGFWGLHFHLHSPGGGIGRRYGLKIRFP